MKSCSSSIYSNSESWLSSKNTAFLLSQQVERGSFSHVTQTSLHPKTKNCCWHFPHSTLFLTTTAPQPSENPFEAHAIKIYPSLSLLTPVIYWQPCHFSWFPESTWLRLPFQSPSIIWVPSRARWFAHTIPSPTPTMSPSHSLSTNCHHTEI